MVLKVLDEACRPPPRQDFRRVAAFENPKRVSSASSMHTPTTVESKRARMSPKPLSEMSRRKPVHSHRHEKVYNSS